MLVNRHYCYWSKWSPSHCRHRRPHFCPPRLHRHDHLLHSLLLSATRRNTPSTTYDHHHGSTSTSTRTRGHNNNNTSLCTTAATSNDGTTASDVHATTASLRRTTTSVRRATSVRCAAHDVKSTSSTNVRGDLLRSGEERRGEGDDFVHFNVSNCYSLKFQRQLGAFIDVSDSRF